MLRRTVAVLAALFLSAGGAYTQDKKDGQDDAQKKADQEAEANAKQKLDEFRTAIKQCRAPGDFVNALDGLAREPHPLILAELKKWLPHGYPEVRIQAAKEIGRFTKDEKAAKALAAAARAEKTVEVAVACVDSIGDIEFKGSAKDLPPLFNHRELDVCKSAIASMADLKTRDCCKPLLDLMGELDAIRDDQQQGQQQGGGGQFGGGGLPGPGGGQLPGGQNQQDEKIKRKRELLPACINAMKLLTGEKYGTVKEWQKWWNKNQKFFKGPSDKEEEKPAEKK